MTSLERIPLTFSTTALNEYLKELIDRFPPVKRGCCYHGWSLLSNDGNWRSGFHEGSSAYNQKGEFNQKTWDENNYHPDTQFNKPTEACFGYGATILKEIHRLGFFPRRARVLGLLPGESTKLHRDHRPGAYWPRLHIPIQTNKKCLMKVGSEVHHMDSDGSVYLLDTSTQHQVENLGDEIRYHLVVQVWDTKHISKHFRYHLPEISNYVLNKDNFPR